MSRPSRLFVSLLLLAGLLAVPGVAGAEAAASQAGGTPAQDATTSPTRTAASTDGDTMNRTFTVSLTPKAPGEIRVELRYEVPDGVTSLTTKLPEDAEVRSTEGFHRRSGNTFDWTRETDTPTVTYDLPVNRSIQRGTEGMETGGYLYVDAGEWAIARAPRAAATYSGAGPRPELVTDYAFTGSGATSGDIIYLGKFEEHRTTAEGQQFRLIVPAAASMRAAPEAVLDSLSGAAESLSVGPRDPEVVAVAAPSTVEWGSTGLQRGESDFWVLDSRGVNTPANVWIHEYVHSRQSYRPTEQTRWTVEGMADYYAALFTYQQGRVDYDRYRGHLKASERHGDVVLADPDTWEGTYADYDKGALVLAALDRQIRLATDGDRTLQEVVRRVNDGTVDQAALLEAVERVGGSEQRSFAREHTETDAVPETWSRSAHHRAFGTARPSFAYELLAPYERTGPYRSDAVGAGPSLVTGESLTVPVAVENTGTATGDFQAILRADGRRIATRTGRLEPGEREVVRVKRRFVEPGEVRLTVGEAADVVTVRRPASVRVSGIDAPRRVTPGEQVTVRATVSNPASRPANGTVTLAADGETLASARVRLDVGEKRVVTARTSFAEGEHRVTAGARERTVRAREGTPTTPSQTGSVTGTHSSTAEGGRGATAGGSTGTPTAGAGAGVGAVGAAAVLLLVGRLFARP